MDTLNKQIEMRLLCFECLFHSGFTVISLSCYLYVSKCNQIEHFYASTNLQSVKYTSGNFLVQNLNMSLGHLNVMSLIVNLLSQRTTFSKSLPPVS